MSYTIIKDPAIEPFHISKDQYCYTVVQTVTPDPANLEKGSEGKNYEKPIGHYSNLSHALKKIAKSKLDLKEEYNSIMDYINEWQRQQDEMNKLLEKIGL